MLETDLEYDVWIDTQVEFLKAGRLGELDIAGLIEELEDLGRREKAACRSFVYQIILHKLLCDYWTTQQRNIGHWQAEINAFQFQLSDRLTTNIRNQLEKDLNEIYLKASKAAVAKIDADSSEISNSMLCLPNFCLYTLDQIIGD